MYLGLKRNSADSVLVMEQRMTEGAWKYAHPIYMCFEDLEAYDRVLQGVLWEVLWEYAR